MGQQVEAPPQAPMYQEPVVYKHEEQEEASTVDEHVEHEYAFMGKEAAETNMGNDEDDDESYDDEDEGPAASSSDGPGASSSTGQGTSSSSDSGTGDSNDNPQASASSSDGPGPQSTASSSATLPDSLQSSSAASSGPDGSSSDAYMRKIALKKGAQSRYMMYLLCNMLEQSGREMLRYALDNPSEQRDALQKRQQLMDALYNLRNLSDVDDDFTHDEFEKEMINIKSARTKVQRLAMRQSDDNAALVEKDSDASSSSDEDHNKDYGEETGILNDARKIMEFHFGKQAKDNEYILPSSGIGGSEIQRKINSASEGKSRNGQYQGTD